MRIIKWPFILVYLAATTGDVAFSAETVDVSDPDRKRAFQFYNQHEMPTAADLFEGVVARFPTDVAAQEAFGVALVSRAQAQTDPDKARSDRLAARRALTQAKELGDTSDLCRTLLAEIPEEGESTQAVSGTPAADAALKAGEAAFARGAWQEAIASYSKAWELDHSWAAALYLGDAYYGMHDMDRAGNWFAKAIELQPNRETAYRYWGDALLTDGKMKEARQKYIEGVVADPYNPTSTTGLKKWLTKNHLAWKTIPITLPPAPSVDENGKTTINVDTSMMAKPDSGGAWLAYSAMRATFRKDEYPKIFPDAKSYRHSLAEEEYALAGAASIYREISTSKGKSKDPSLDLLAKFKDEELLAPFVLFAHVDQGIAKDYNAYREGHRDKLIAFIDRYMVPAAP